MQQRTSWREKWQAIRRILAGKPTVYRCWFHVDDMMNGNMEAADQDDGAIVNCFGTRYNDLPWVRTVWLNDERDYIERLRPHD